MKTNSGQNFYQAHDETATATEDQAKPDAFDQQDFYEYDNGIPDIKNVASSNDEADDRPDMLKTLSEQFAQFNEYDEEDDVDYTKYN